MRRSQDTIYSNFCQPWLPKAHLFSKNVTTGWEFLRLFCCIFLWKSNSSLYESSKHTYIYGKFRTFLQFEGNDCNRILRPQNVSKLKRDLPDHLKKFASVLERFNEVKAACFGMSLDDSWKDKIQAFAIAFRDLGISETPKGKFTQPEFYFHFHLRYLNKESNFTQSIYWFWPIMAPFTWRSKSSAKRLSIKWLAVKKILSNCGCLIQILSPKEGFS